MGVQRLPPTLTEPLVSKLAPFTVSAKLPEVVPVLESPIIPSGSSAHVIEPDQLLG